MAEAKLITRLEPQDEYTHTPDAATNYNESMYFNVFDPRPRSAAGSGSATGPTRATPR
jgi:hypothetical protein